MNWFSTEDKKPRDGQLVLVILKGETHPKLCVYENYELGQGWFIAFDNKSVEDSDIEFWCLVETPKKK